MPLPLRRATTPRRPRSVPLVGVPLLGVTLLLAACGGGTDGDSAPATSGPATTVPATGGTVTTVPASDGTAGSTTAPPETTTSGPVDPDTGLPAVRLTPLATLDEPTAFAMRAGDPALYVAERAGFVRAIRDGDVDTRPVLDVSARTRAGGERGLLGMAFSPDGRFLYLHFSDLQGHTNVVEYTVGDGGRIDAGSARLVLFEEQPYPNHNGGHLAFGPDGMLWIGLGDGGAQGDPQRLATDPASLLGKMLRIDPRPAGDRAYGIPADNPWAGGGGGHRPELWATGLRNPWRYSFDRATGDLWIADVGQNWMEEVTMVPAAGGTGKGAFFGWSALEGTTTFNADVSADGAVAPTYTYDRDTPPGGCSITGGYVYRGSRIPGLQGHYLFADYCTSVVRALKPAADGDGFTEVSIADGATNVVSFGQDAQGELYVLSLEGQVWRLDPA